MSGFGSSIGASVAASLQTASITGSPTYDAILMAGLISVVLGGIKTLSDYCSVVMTALIQYIISYMTNRFKNRLIGGDILADIYLDKDSDVFRFIKQYIFDAKIPSDLDVSALHAILGEDDQQEKNKKKETYDENGERISNPKDDNAGVKNSFIRYWTIDSEEREKKMEVKLNYASVTEDMFKNTDYYGYDSDVTTKIFKYDNQKDNVLSTYIIKMVLRESKYHSSMKLNLISSNEKFKKDLKSTYVKIVEKFLDERFQMKKNMEYVYKIILSGPICPKLEYLSSSGKVWSDRELGTMKFSDPYETSQTYSGVCSLIEDDIISTNDLAIGLRAENISDINRDYTKCIDIFTTAGHVRKHISGYSSNHFFYYYRKYIDSTTDENMSRWGYYVKNTHLYLMYRINSVWYLCIITHGKIFTKKTLREEIDQFIKMILTADVNQGQGKTDIGLYKRTTDNQWKSYTIDQRNFDTIFLPSSTMREIKNEIDMFVAKEKLYRTYQIPYKKGILFYGPPGTGKTSLVKSLAYEYQFNIYMINVNDDDINDDTICDILNSIGGGGNKILLFEDIDTAFADKEQIKEHVKNDISTNDIQSIVNASSSSSTIQSKTTSSKTKTKTDNTETVSSTIDKNALANIMQNINKPKKYLTYSGLLNALDGVLSNQQGVITIMTTNYRERLGDAFLRPGRIDRQFELKECNDEQIIDMTTKFIQRRIDLLKKDEEKEYYTDTYVKAKAIEMAEKLVDKKGMSVIKPCELQYYLLRYIDSPDDIFTHIGELSNPII